MFDLTGQTLGQYQLHELMGAGGMGAVYRAYQQSLQREVALKVIAPQAASTVDYERLFAREARTAATLEHSHIVPVYDFGTENGNSFVVMRLLRGGTLADRVMQSGWADAPLSQVIPTLNALTSALAYAHERHVIHRDIKPNNVMFDDHGTPFLVDFGLAKLVGHTTHGTISGPLSGTPGFMAPEQWRGDPITAATDQYALAILIYLVLTGQPVFDADTHFAIMHKHIYETPALMTHWRDSLPKAIVPILLRALRKDPKTRYPNVTVFAQELTKAANADPTADPPDLSANVMPAPRNENDTLILSQESDASPVTHNENNTLILPQEPDESPTPKRTMTWTVMAAVALIAIIAGAVILLPGLSSGATTMTDTPTVTLESTATTGPTLNSVPAMGAGATKAPTMSSTPQPTNTRQQTNTPTQTDTAQPTNTDTAQPTNTATHTPSPTFTSSPRSTTTPKPTSTTASPLAIIAEVSCDQMDINGDGVVNIYDLRMIAAVIGSINESENYRPEYDFDNNNVIDDFDLTRVTSQYDRRCT